MVYPEEENVVDDGLSFFALLELSFSPAGDFWR